MPLRLFAHVLVLVPLLGSLGCSNRPELSRREQSAVDRLTRDQWVDLVSIERESSDSLVVVTRQGDVLVPYRVTIHDEGRPTIQRLPLVSGPAAGSPITNPAVTGVTTH